MFAVLRPMTEVYKISVLLWYKFAKKNNLIRCQTKINSYMIPNSNREKSSISEATYSIPIEILEKVEVPQML